jgi:transposase
VLRQEHRAGEKMFVDYAGATIPVQDPQSGEVHPAAVFVAVLGASSYTFAEATSGQDLRNWIGSHVRAFEYFGGTVEVVVPDNLKSAVTHPSYYEPDLNPTYRDLGEHYGVAIIPARPYRARDKAKAEVGVQVVQRWIVAALRKRKFFSLGEVNQAIRRVADATQSAAVSETRRQPCHAVRATGPAGAEALAGYALSVRPMEDRPRQHRLSRRSGAALLQRPLRAGASTG